MGSVAEPIPNEVKPAEHPYQDGGGKFKKGNPGGPGNPHQKRIAEYRRQFFEAITPEMAKKLVQQQYALAISGDVDAAKLIWPYIFGRVPVEEAEVIPNGDGSVTIRLVPALPPEAPLIGPALPPPGQ